MVRAIIAATLLIRRTTAQRRVALIGARKVAEQEKAMFDGAVDGMLLLDARGEIVRAGHSIVFVRGLIDNEGRPVLAFSATIKKLKKSRITSFCS